MSHAIEPVVYSAEQGASHEVRNEANLKTSIALHIARGEMFSRAGHQLSELPPEVKSAMESNSRFTPSLQHQALGWIEERVLEVAEIESAATADGLQSAAQASFETKAFEPHAAIDAHLSVGERSSGVESIDTEAILALQDVFNSLAFRRLAQ